MDNSKILLDKVVSGIVQLKSFLLYCSETYDKAGQMKNARLFKEKCTLTKNLEIDMGLIAQIIQSYQILDANNVAQISQLNATVTADTNTISADASQITGLNTTVASLTAQVAQLQSEIPDAADLAAITGAQADPAIASILAGIQASAAPVTSGKAS
jgi:cell division protein FtsB